MSMRTTVLMLAMGVALVGCNNKDQAKDEAADVPAQPAAASAAADAAPAGAGAASPPAGAASAAAAQATVFDIGTIAVSDKPLGTWPYVPLPAGYVFERADDLASRSKDLARVPVWTGAQLLWVEGRVFSDGIDSQDGKTYSQFEVRKNLRQALEGMGAVRLAERSFDDSVRNANEREVSAFIEEFSEMYYPYQSDQDAETWVVRGADKATWVVFHSGNSDGHLMVAEGPLPVAPAK
ncbi:hypothetical protein [Thermomonas sp.]|jgi:hypothetical protein|uniref:hypothetical protein n=1 Tax=Thermomonas sp. TaxID=1971895 RepID=UPI003784CB03